MKTKRTMYFFVGLVLAGPVNAAPESVTLADVAELHCAAEWAQFSEMEPDAWAAFQPIVVDPDLDPDAHMAFNKYSASVVAIADYFGAFLGLSDPVNQTEGYLTSARVKYELAKCLVPTDVDRDRIVTVASATSEASEQDIRKALFRSFDQFDCMGVADASDALFRLDLSEQTTINFAEFAAEHMRTCD